MIGLREEDKIWNLEPVERNGPGKTSLCRETQRAAPTIKGEQRVERPTQWTTV